MIIHSDAAQLEWRSYLELSQDWVGIRELQEGQDVHNNNKNRFNLPTRLVSKTFLFRWIYRGSAYAYSVDNDFIPVSTDPDYWQKVIDAANEKYSILYEFQEKIIRMAKEYKVITIPTGREFLFELSKNAKEEYYWDIKKIVNYINQGFGADIMVMMRYILRRKLFKDYDPESFALMNTIHDSVDCDVDNDPELLYNICIDTEDSYSKVPEFFTQYYGKPFHTPIKGEVSFGMNVKELTPFDRTKGKEQFLCALKS